MRERMADVGDRDAGLFIERRLEGKQRKQAMRRTGDRHDPLAPPRPHRRAHEMDGAHPAAFEFPFEPQVEIGRVDADEHPDPRFSKPLRQRAPQAQQLRHATEHFGKSANGERLERNPRLAAGFLHFGSRHADKTHARNPRANGLDQ